jgi:hypothetical protein|tara:strand:- start:50 stop:289 length:240 start_codon:yes stop_codon:yes gene_type:complete
MSKGRPPSVIPPIVVVYRKREKGKAYMSVFEGINVDSIINGRKKTSLIPDNYLIEEIGIGSYLIDSYKKSYGIKNIRKL